MITVSELPTLQMCVEEAYNEDDFVKEFNRLNGTSLKSGDGLEKRIDDVTGKTKDDLVKFINMVDVFIYQPLLKRALEENRQ